MKATKVKDARIRSTAVLVDSNLTDRAFQSWVDFWFRPTDPIGMHAIRILSGILFLAWLLPFAGQLDALFGLQGWFDQQAYREASRLPEGTRPQFGWSVLFWCGSNPTLLKTAYGASLAVLALFTLGIATRLTAVLTWGIVVSFTANPATSYDADVLLVVIAFYLMIGYVFLDQRNSVQTLGSRLLGRREMCFRLAGSPDEPWQLRPRSVAANVAMRLLQVHLAIVIVTSGLHKLQFGDWWAGVAFWYPLYPALETTAEKAREYMANRVSFLVILSLAAYVTLCWQVAFPVFAWRRSWRKILLAGASAGWLSNAFLYELPLFGPAIFIGCLSFVSAAEWQRVCDRLVSVCPVAGASQK